MTKAALPLAALLFFEIANELNATVPPDQVTIDQYQVVDRFVWDCAKHFSASSIAKVRHLGKIQKEITSKSRAPNDPSFVIQWHTLTFEGLEITGAMNRGVFDPSHIVITSGKWLVPHGLNVGATKATLLAELGKPQRSSNEQQLEYRGNTEEASFTVIDGLITRIELRLYSD